MTPTIIITIVALALLVVAIFFGTAWLDARVGRKVLAEMLRQRGGK